MPKHHYASLQHEAIETYKHQENFNRKCKQHPMATEHQVCYSPISLCSLENNYVRDELGSSKDLEDSTL